MVKRDFLYLLFFKISFICAQSPVDTVVHQFPVPIFTNSNLSLLVLESAWENAPTKGDEWAVIDAQGQIVGSSPIYEGHNGMPVWGDASNTSIKDGLIHNERFSILHWHKENDVYNLYSNFSIYRGTVTYVKDGFTIVNSLGVPSDYVRPTDVYYHLKSVLSEFNVFSVYVSQSGSYSLVLSLGDEIIFEQNTNALDCGFYSYNYKSELSNGHYTLSLYSSGNQVIEKRFFILN